MKTLKNKSGFSLAELLLAIAIMLILMGLAFVAVNSYVRGLRLNEMDWTAKELFLSAQNQLSKAKENGTLANYKDNLSDSPANKIEGTSRYYVVYDGLSSKPNYSSTPNDESAWEMLMPFGAIDEKVRLAGSYIIEFDLDAATVTQVYYSDNYNFTAGEYANNENGIRDGIEDKGTRKNYRNEYIIGWYKGDASNLVFADDFLNPILKVTNAEELTAEVINPNGNCVILLCIQGVRSGATTTIRLNTANSYKYVHILYGAFSI